MAVAMLDVISILYIAFTLSSAGLFLPMCLHVEEG
jgi:hypothetical protein